MSTKKTEHYQLNAWELGDDFLMSEINENFGAIDKAIWSRCRVVFGSYTGTGTENQFIQLDLTPKAVIIVCGGVSWNGSINYGGIIFPGWPSNGAQIDEGGFTVKASSNGSFCRSNLENSKYQYIAFYWEE